MDECFVCELMKDVKQEDEDFILLRKLRFFERGN